MAEVARTLIPEDFEQDFAENATETWRHLLGMQNTAEGDDEGTSISSRSMPMREISWSQASPTSWRPLSWTWLGLYTQPDHCGRRGPSRSPCRRGRRRTTSEREPRAHAASQNVVTSTVDSYCCSKPSVVRAQSQIQVALHMLHDSAAPTTL